MTYSEAMLDVAPRLYFLVQDHCSLRYVCTFCDTPSCFHVLRTLMQAGKMKKISAAAYMALRDALPAIIWNKRPFESFLRTALRGHGELLAELNFSDTKRVVTDQLVDRLTAEEGRYHDLTLQLMLEISRMTRFPNLEQLKDPEDRKLRLNEAEAAVGLLSYIIKDYSREIADAENEKVSIQEMASKDAAERRFSDDLESLKARFIDLQAEADVHARGYAFERLLADLFHIFDLEPRLSYKLPNEQIDGSFTFDTDDYIVEARWRAEAASREDGDAFAMKVRRKGKNAVGLFVSVNGFTKPFKDSFRESTPFISLDGSDLYAVLDKRIRFDDLIRAKKRHANETGSCFLPASAIISEGEAEG